MEQYIESNVEKFDENCWNQVTDTFTSLFEKTTAYGLFDDTQDLIEKVKANSPKGIHILMIIIIITLLFLFLVFIFLLFYYFIINITTI